MSLSKRLLQIAVIFLALVFLAFFSAVGTMKLVTWSRTTAVPDVSGKPLPTAINDLRAAGLEIAVARQEHHASVPEGSVIAQTPKAGALVKRGRSVAVIVSLGSEEVKVPDFAGMPLWRAQMGLKQAGLTLGETIRVSAEMFPDKVYMQTPPGQSVVQKGSAVDLLVSDGPRQARFVAPELVGKTRAEAAEAVKPLPLKLAAAGKGDIVVSQEPKPGYPVMAADSVNVTLGNGPGVTEPVKESPLKERSGI